jgi:hypothetical protein
LGIALSEQLRDPFVRHPSRAHELLTRLDLAIAKARTDDIFTDEINPTSTQSRHSWKFGTRQGAVAGCLLLLHPPHEIGKKRSDLLAFIQG